MVHLMYFVKVFKLYDVIYFRYKKRGIHMFNSVNNPFNRRIESSTSSDKNGGQQKQQEQQQQEHQLLEENEGDEVKIGGRPILSEADITYLVKEYILKIKSEHEGDEKIAQKADKWLTKFNVQKFMKNNPNITISDFNMIMYSETDSIRN